VVLANLKSAFSEKNIENYMRCLTDSTQVGKSFQFVPDPTVKLKYPGVFEDWDLARERNYVHHLFSLIPDDSASTLIFMGEGETINYPDSTVIIRDYRLLLGHTLESPQYPRWAEGRMEVHLARIPQGDWAIFYWVDTATQGNPSWSDVKANFGK